MQIVMDEIIEESPDCSFSMVAGQQSAKQALQVCTGNATTTFLIVIAKYFSIFWVKSVPFIVVMAKRLRRRLFFVFGDS